MEKNKKQAKKTSKKTVKLDLEVVELEAKLAPESASMGSGGYYEQGAEC